MTTEQVYKLAATDSELLSHIKSRKLRYLRHIMMIITHDNIEGSVMTGLVEGTRKMKKPWKTKDIGTNPSAQPTVAKRRRRSDMTCRDAR